jgi:serine/threonine-protein kinase
MTSPFLADLPRWRRINTLLKEALALPRDQHEQWLDGVREQADVAPLLRALLARQAVETDAFMGRSVAAVWAQAVGPSAAGEAPGQHIGPYQLLRELGKGGMGTVWLAQRADGVPQRQVAVKLPLSGWARGVAEGLEQERDTLAALEHPNIARLYDAGVTAAGRPYLAMEYVDGLPIDIFAAEHRLTVRARLALFRQVAGAVAYAHGRLIVHRDLKPTNILVTPDGDVRLLDFGAAKLLRDHEPQDSALTQETGRALSPDYASPEQIHGESITVATDVYSLGVVLFELLTGRRPYSLQRHSTAALEAAIVEAEVPLPSSVVAHDRKLRRELRGDLDNIVAKALKKSPQERYGTIGVFADDVQRWLDHEPVSARRDSITYRLGKFVRRNRVAVAAGTLVFAALTVAATVTTSEMFEARKQRDEARVQAKHAQAEERFANMVMEQFGPGGRPLTREEMLDRSVQILDQQYGNDPRFVAEALIPISDRYMELGNTDKELAVLQRAESIARRLADAVLLIDIQCNMVETELDKGRIDRAQQHMNEARTLLANTRNVQLKPRIDCIHAEATLADARGDRATAVERIETAIALQERADRTDRTYRDLLSHAQVLYLYAGRPKDAFAVIEKTLRVLEATDAKNGEALSGAIHNQSLALIQMGEVRAALARERDAVAITTGNDADRPVAALMAQMLGRLYTRMNRAAEGEAWAERALTAARAGGNVGAQVVALAALAEAHAEAGHIEQASASADHAARLLNPSSNPRERTAATRARALVALKRNDIDGADIAAAALLDAIGYPDMEKVRTAQSADMQLLLAARVALKGGQSHYAERLAADALELASGLARDPQGSAAVGEARLLLARALHAQGETESARTSIRGAARALGAGLSSDHPLTIEATGLEARLNESASPAVSLNR